MRTAASRSELPAWCSKHNLAFVKFEAGGGYGPNFSFGCPTCVAEAREITRRAREQYRKAKERLRYPEDTGKGKPR